MTQSEKVPFEIRGFSLATLFLGASGALTVSSFIGFFLLDGASETSLGFVYGLPGLLLGLALKYAELEPVPFDTTPGMESEREAKATDTMKEIIKDVTRHRYGDEAHLEEALRALKLIPRGEGPPEMIGMSEALNEKGEYCLGLKFSSNKTPYKSWLESGP